jgi:predicted P-loop ATPase
MWKYNPAKDDFEEDLEAYNERQREYEISKEEENYHAEQEHYRVTILTLWWTWEENESLGAGVFLFLIGELEC